MKQNVHKHKAQIFQELVPSILPLLKEEIRLGHAGIDNKFFKKDWTDRFFFNRYINA